MNVECKDCIYFVPNEFGNPHLGQCRFSSPEAMLIDGRAATRWPVIHESEWCGEHSVPASEEASPSV